MVTGLPVGQSDALSLFTILPPGKHYDDKFVYGLYVRGTKCDTVRIGVLHENDAARRFWLKIGFKPTGEVKPYRYGAIDTKTAIHAKALARMTADDPSSGRQ